MANLTPVESFDDVRRIDKSDPVLGYDPALPGAGIGVANLPAEALTNRTEWLKKRIGVQGSWDLSGTPELPSGAAENKVYVVSAAGSWNSTPALVGDLVMLTNGTSDIFVFHKAAGGGGGGGGGATPISGNVEIKIPTDYATWDLCRAYLDANVFTGQVKVVFESSTTLTTAIVLDDMFMPNLTITTDGVVSVDTTSIPAPFGIVFFIQGFDATIHRLCGKFTQTAGPAAYCLGVAQSDMTLGAKNPLTMTDSPLELNGFAGAVMMSSTFRGDGGRVVINLGYSGELEFNECNISGLDLKYEGAKLKIQDSSVGSAAVALFSRLELTHTDTVIEADSGECRISNFVIPSTMALTMKAGYSTKLEVFFATAATVSPATDNTTIFYSYYGGVVHTNFYETLTFSPAAYNHTFASGDTFRFKSRGVGVEVDTSTYPDATLFETDNIEVQGLGSSCINKGAGWPRVFLYGVNHPGILLERHNTLEEVSGIDGSTGSYTPFNLSTNVAFTGIAATIPALTVDLTYNEACEFTVSADKEITALTIAGFTFTLPENTARTFIRNNPTLTWYLK